MHDDFRCEFVDHHLCFILHMFNRISFLRLKWHLTLCDFWADFSSDFTVKIYSQHQLFKLYFKYYACNISMYLREEKKTLGQRWLEQSNYSRYSRHKTIWISICFPYNSPTYVFMHNARIYVITVLVLTPKGPHPWFSLSLSLLSLHQSCFSWQMTGGFDICWWSNIASQAKSNRVKCEKYSCWLYFLLVCLTLNRSASTRKPHVNHFQILSMIFVGWVGWTWSQSALCLPSSYELGLFSLREKRICV